MILLRMAWDNLFYNGRRTLITVLLLAAVITGLVLFKGYIVFVSEGIARGFIATTGNLKIAKTAYWENKKHAALNSDEFNLLQNRLAQDSRISFIDPVLEFYGLIGTIETSTVFYSAAHDNPEYLYTIDEGSSITEGDSRIVIDSATAKKLSIDFNGEPPSVNLLATPRGEERPWYSQILK